MVYFVIILRLIVKVPGQTEGQSEQLAPLLINLNFYFWRCEPEPPGEDPHGHGESLKTLHKKAHSNGLEPTTSWFFYFEVFPVVLPATGGALTRVDDVTLYKESDRSPGQDTLSGGTLRCPFDRCQQKAKLQTHFTDDFRGKSCFSCRGSVRTGGPGGSEEVTVTSTPTPGQTQFVWFSGCNWCEEERWRPAGAGAGTAR